MTEALPLGAQEAGGGAALMGKLRMADRGMVEVHTTLKMHSLKLFIISNIFTLQFIFGFDGNCGVFSGDLRSSWRAGEDRQS